MGGITLRELDAKQITETVAQLCKEAAYYLPKDVYEGLKKGRETEKSPVGQAVLDQIIKKVEDLVLASLALLLVSGVSLLV